MFCNRGGNNQDFEKHYDIEYKPIMTDYPKHIKLCYDYECNCACVICRDRIQRLKQDELVLLNKKIDTFFIPLLKHAELLTVNTGDAFGSRHTRELIKKTIKEYPNLKFDFTTNGILCNEKIFKKLNIIPDRIHTIRISVHAATKKTYGKMIKNGEKLFDTLINNLNYISNLKQRNNFNFILNFVVSKQISI